MATIDVRNLACPAPLIKTKQALDKAEPGSTLQIVGNGAIPSNNLKNYLNELGINYKEVQVEEEWILSFVVPEMGKTEVDAGSFCPTGNAAPAQGQTAPTKGAPVPPQNAPGQNPEAFQKTGRTPYMVVLKSLKMGQGEDALGGLLMKSYVNVLPELEHLPQTICMYNEGVKLAIEGSPVLEALQKLEAKGVKIIVCGTCTEYYSVSDKLKTGQISNMFHIANLMASCPKVVYP